MAKKPAIGDEAVRAKTGKTWREWFALLDKAGAKAMAHRDIAACLREKHAVGDWWSQMVAVGYEQARGLRAAHEKPGGYEISVSKTIGASAAALHRAFADARTRKRWLPDPAITIRTSTSPRRLRATWADGATVIDVNVLAKGAGKAQLTVQHGKLRDARAAAKMKKYWAAALAELRKIAE